MGPNRFTQVEEKGRLANEAINTLMILNGYLQSVCKKGLTCTSIVSLAKRIVILKCSISIRQLARLRAVEPGRHHLDCRYSIFLCLGPCSLPFRCSWDTLFSRLPFHSTALWNYEAPLDTINSPTPSVRPLLSNGWKRTRP